MKEWHTHTCMYTHPQPYSLRQSWECLRMARVPPSFLLSCFSLSHSLSLFLDTPDWNIDVSQALLFMPKWLFFFQRTGDCFTHTHSAGIKRGRQQRRRSASLIALCLYTGFKCLNCSLNANMLPDQSWMWLSRPALISLNLSLQSWFHILWLSVYQQTKFNVTLKAESIWVQLLATSPPNYTLQSQSLYKWLLQKIILFYENWAQVSILYAKPSTMTPSFKNFCSSVTSGCFHFCFWDDTSC